jgi:adenylylsulfate kinase
LEICEQRDVKGLYRRARLGEIKEFTGVSAPYEEPRNSDLKLDTGTTSVEECAGKVVELLIQKGVVQAARRAGAIKTAGPSGAK